MTGVTGLTEVTDDVWETSLPSGGLVEVVFLEVLSEVGVSVVPE